MLVPVLERAGTITLGFTLRSEKMPTHAGQISFPGGRAEPGDTDLTDTALREACEELGIDRSVVDVAGPIDDVATPVGFVITPVVGWLRDPPPIRPDEREVELYFEIELEELIEPGNFGYEGEREIAGVTYPTPVFHVGGHRIWGATARITQRFLEVVGAVQA